MAAVCLGAVDRCSSTTACSALVVARTQVAIVAHGAIGLRIGAESGGWIALARVVAAIAGRAVDGFAAAATGNTTVVLGAQVTVRTGSTVRTRVGAKPGRWVAFARVMATIRSSTGDGLADARSGDTLVGLSTKITVVTRCPVWLRGVGAQACGRIASARVVTRIERLACFREENTQAVFATAIFRAKIVVATVGVRATRGEHIALHVYVGMFVQVAGCQVRRQTGISDRQGIARQRGCHVEHRSVGLFSKSIDVHEEGALGDKVAHEHTGHLVVVLHHDVRGFAAEGDKTSGTIDCGGERNAVTVSSEEAHTDPLGLLRQPVVHEDVDEPVAIVRDQIGGNGLERHKAAIGADAREDAVSVADLASGASTDELHSAVGAVANKYVEYAVGVVGDEVGRGGDKGDKPAVRTDCGLRRRAVCLNAVAHAFRKALLAIAHEDVSRTVGIFGDEIIGEGLKSNEASAGVDTRRAARPITFHARAAHTHSLRAPYGPQTNKNVRYPIEVAYDQVRGIRVERHNRAVGTDGRVVPGAMARPIGLCTAVANADALGLPEDTIAHEHVAHFVRVAGYQIGSIGIKRHEAAVAA